MNKSFLNSLLQMRIPFLSLSSNNGYTVAQTVSGKESSFSDTVTAESTTDQDAVNLSKNGNEATDCCHLSSQNDTVETDITKAMEEEEESLQLETNKEQQETLQEAKKEWKSMEDKQRYLRLQLLLDKSEIYCKFLQERMEKQRVDAQKHQERMAKKEEKQKRQGANSTQQVPQIEHRVTRSAKVKLRVLSTHPQADHVVPSRRKQGIRRKAQDSSSYMLDKYLDSESLAKRQKLMDGEKQHEKETFILGPSSEDDKEQEVVHGSSDVENSSLQPTLVTGGSLRPYQLKGLAWLKGLYENGMNGILADEMGLGKTLQCISMVAFLIEMRVKGPFLVAAPLSTLPNWVHEFHKFTPKIPVILYHGSQEERLKLRLQIDSLKTVEENISAYPVVVTSYEICMRDQKTLHSLEWKYFIVDEGHRIKNLNCKLIKELKTYNTANRLLLTGTPLQNNLSELWSLLNFLLPDIFDDLDSFQKWFDFRAINEHGGSERIIEQEREHQVLERLHAILTPFLLRRLKSDVALHLPPKKEVLVYAPLTQKQETFYKAALDGTILDLVGDKREDLPLELSETGRPKRKGRQDISYKLFFSDSIDEEDLQELSGKHNERNMPGPSAPSSVLNIRMTNILMLLRKCCNHPYLLECPLEEGTLLRKVDEDLVNCSGKMLLLDRMLPSLKEGGHKVLLFTQMTKMMDIIEDYCILRNYGYSRLDGTMKVSDRQEEMKKFEVDPSVFVFLISTRAGGLGLNLAVADTVIIYDSDWNPQVDLQAQDRSHRIGQTRPVVVYRFVTANTIDQKIVERASTKRKLEKMIIHKGKFKGSKDTSVIDARELRDLLMSRDHDSVVKSDGLVIGDRDLEALLDRSDLHSKFDASSSNANLKHHSQQSKNTEFFRVLDKTH